MQRLSSPFWVYSGLLLCLCAIVSAEKKCDRKLKGPGGCRGPEWDAGSWPLLAGERNLEECCLACQKKDGCTGFHLARSKHDKASCYLFGHSEFHLQHGLGGECYEIVRDDDDDDDDDHDYKHCKKYLQKACPKVEGGKNKKKKEDVVKPKPDDKKERKKENVKEEKKNVEKTKAEKPGKAEIAKDEVVKKEKAKEMESGNVVTTKDQMLRKEEVKVKKEEAVKEKKKDSKAVKTEEQKTQEDKEVKVKAEQKKNVEASVKDEKKEEKKKNKSNESEKKKSKVSKTETILFDGKYLLKLGDGGCRGPGWDRKGCPKFLGRKTQTDCAEECRKSEYCTAFHTLKHSTEDDTEECVLFGHKDIVVVKALGGQCFTFSNHPPKEKPAVQKTKKKARVHPVGPVREIVVGKGLCRGRGWSSEDWPIVLVNKNLEECTRACVEEPECTAFDLSENSEHVLMCHLYAHEGVEPASDLPGTCYTIFGSDLAKKLMLEDEDFIEDLEEEIEEEIEIVLKEPARYDLLGPGVCRGENWQVPRRWPKVLGPQSLQQCADACKRKKGCVSFDLTPSADDKNQKQCHLYGHKSPTPASNVPGECYKLDLDPTDDEDEEEDASEDRAKTDGRHEHREVKSPIDDGSLDKLAKRGQGFELIGDGLCRGPNWSNEFWPKEEGLESLDGCFSDCKHDPGCTAFELSPSHERGEYRCVIYGHDKVYPASDIRGKCYKMLGRKALTGQQSKRSSTKYNNLGKGLCRGQNWQGEEWPQDKGRRSEKECYAACVATPGCTAFDTSNPSKRGKKIQCFLYGHKDVRPAENLEGNCFTVSKVKPKTDGPSKKILMPAATELGVGLCRGLQWQDGVSWPQDKGVRSLKECYAACKQTPGCTAFDAAPIEKSRKKINCLLYGHTDVQPAFDLKGTCYKMTQVKTPSRDSPIGHLAHNEFRVGNTAIAKKLEQGACRGESWQEGIWPIDSGRQSRRGCAEICVRTGGCTAFDVRKASTHLPENVHHVGDENDFECTLYGHKDVNPASGVPADCYLVTLLDPTTVKKSKPAAKETKKKIFADKKPNLKIPDFEAPKVLEEDEDVSEGWLFDPPPPEIRSRKHIETILHLAEEKNQTFEHIVETTLKELKKVYENSIKPLENIYKYKELSNRHFGDPEIFNKPLVVLMGPWSGGKSSTLNYILGTEYTKDAFRTGAEPSAGFNFNIAMYGDTEEEISGTEFAAEWTFSSLQKFGQEFLKKLKGKKLPNSLLEKATFAEIPGVLETGSARKVDRGYPFNDACQWFIDHADLILLVYDYTKLDIGPETEALLDQLKGRESQVRILLNKADEITAEELMKIQGNLLWNVSPHMSSNLEPPIVYAGSFWSHPYKSGALKDLLRSQEISLLRDIDDAIEKRVENRIATARRFAVRVRNHAKMVDVYLARFNSQRGLFGNKKKTAEDIIDNPDKYHIYEGISTMTNISRYDLPDPKSYKTFFGLHPLEEFPSLQSTCTFFKGCPINKLDLAIAYDLPELLTAYKKKIGPKK